MGKARLVNTNDLDGRTRAARRARALERHLISAFDCELPPQQLILIRSAAELAAIAEQVRATHLAGGPVSLNDVVRAENAMARAVRALQLPAAPAKPVGNYAESTVIVISEDDAKL